MKYIVGYLSVNIILREINLLCIYDANFIFVTIRELIIVVIYIQGQGAIENEADKAAGNE